MHGQHKSPRNPPICDGLCFHGNRTGPIRGEKAKIRGMSASGGLNNWRGISLSETAQQTFEVVQFNLRPRSLPEPALQFAHDFTRALNLHIGRDPG